MYSMYPTVGETHPTVGHPQPRLVSDQGTPGQHIPPRAKPLTAGLDSTLKELVDVLL